MALVCQGFFRYLPRNALELFAALDGVSGSRCFRLYRHNRILLCKRPIGFIGGLFSRIGILGRFAVGLENAAGSSGRFILAPQSRVCLLGRKLNGDEFDNHGRANRSCPMDGNPFTVGCLVYYIGTAFAGGIRAAGCRSRCHDCRGGANSPGRRHPHTGKRSSTDACDGSNPGPRCHNRRQRSGCRTGGLDGSSALLRDHVQAFTNHTDYLGNGCHPGQLDNPATSQKISP